MTVCVQRAAGDPTARCPATARTERPAPLTRALANAHLDIGAPPASAFVRQDISAIAVARRVRSVSIATAHVTTCPASVTACLDSKEHSAMKCVPVAGMARTVPWPAPAPITGRATPSTAPANATQDGLAVTALSPVHRVSGAPTASTRVTATMVRGAAPTTGSASVHQDGPGSTARSAAP